MLCAPPSQVYDRLTSMLSSTSVVSGLVLSAMAGAALNPLDISAYDDALQSSAEAYNVIAALTVVTQLCVVLYSSFTLYIVTANAHDSTATYRSLVHMTRWIGFLEFFTFVPALSSFVLIVLATRLHCGTVSTWVVIGVTVTLVVVFQSAFCWMCIHAFPYNAWAWTMMATGGLGWLKKGFRAAAKSHGELLLAKAEEGVLGGMDDDGDGVIDEADFEVQVLSTELSAFVESALQGLGATRCSLLTKELHAAGLSRSRMIEAARHPGGFQVLCELLAMHAVDEGLRPGDRLALATAAMRAAASEPGPVDAPSVADTGRG